VNAGFIFMVSGGYALILKLESLLTSLDIMSRLRNAMACNQKMTTTFTAHSPPVSYILLNHISDLN